VGWHLRFLLVLAEVAVVVASGIDGVADEWQSVVVGGNLRVLTVSMAMAAERQTMSS
jgi:hypothetical protein